tara:strand:+ start:1095 stop:2399 length:1305 start_codon:yes stop_codon:yes gene_type:complete
MVSVAENLSDKIAKQSWYPWFVWGLGAAFFFAEYFARLGPNVMVPELMQVFHMDALGLGILFSYFYWPYIIMQLPVGLFVDRYGAQSMLVIMTALCALSCYLFGHAESLWIAEMARFLLGIAGAFAFVATLKLATVWFPASRFGLLAGATQAVGMLGAAFGEGPVAWISAHLGWRHTFLYMALFFLFLSGMIMCLVRDRKPQTHQNTLQKGAYAALWKGLQQVLKNKQTWYNALFAALIFAPTGTFAELWGVTYLEHVQHLSHPAAANAISMVFLGWGIGGPLCGFWSDRLQQRKPMMYYSAIASLFFLTCVLYWTGLSAPVLFLLLFCYGVANSGLVIAYAISGEINPQYVAGISMAFANMASVILAPLFQDLAGYILVDQWDGAMVKGIPYYSATAYEWSTVVLPVSLVLAFFVAMRVKETHCQRIESYTDS